MPDDPRVDLSQAALVRYLGHETPAVTAHANEPATKGLHPGWWATVIGAQIADALTTQAALERGAVERNPLMRGLTAHPTANLLAKAGIGAGIAGLAHLAHKKSPKAGKVLAAIGTAVPTIAAVKNSRTSRE